MKKVKEALARGRKRPNLWYQSGLNKYLSFQKAVAIAIKGLRDVDIIAIDRKGNIGSAYTTKTLALLPYQIMVLANLLITFPCRSETSALPLMRCKELE